MSLKNVIHDSLIPVVNAEDVVTTIAPGKTHTFTIQPKGGMSPGGYTDQILVKAKNANTLTINASVIVKTAATPTPSASAKATSSTALSRKSTAGRTCQDDGYPTGYEWSDSKQTCVCTSAACRIKSIVNTGEDGQQPILYIAISVAGLMLVLLIMHRKPQGGDSQTRP